MSPPERFKKGFKLIPAEELYSAAWIRFYSNWNCWWLCGVYAVLYEYCTALIFMYSMDKILMRKMFLLILNQFYQLRKGM